MEKDTFDPSKPFSLDKSLKQMKEYSDQRRAEALREDHPREPQPVYNKSDWGPGAWQSEPDRVDWRRSGLPCFIQRHPEFGQWCGYVGVPQSHPAWEKFYDDVDVNVHGGLTYASKCSGYLCHEPLPGEADNVWWLGFDCLHVWDMAPGMAATMRRIMPPEHDYDNVHKNDIYRTLEYVTAETNQLANQLAAMVKEVGNG